MRLNDLRDNPGARTPRKRIGRGIGSGTGKTSGKGHKGQRARAGTGGKLGFEGGQMPLYRRLPKRGFKNPFRKTFAVVNVGRLQKAVDAGRLDPAVPVDEAMLVASGVAGGAGGGIRLLAKGELTTALNLTVTGASAAAIAAVERAGGRVTVTAPRPRAEPVPDADGAAPDGKQAPATSASAEEAAAAAAPEDKKKSARAKAGPEDAGEAPANPEKAGKAKRRKPETSPEPSKDD